MKANITVTVRDTRRLDKKQKNQGIGHYFQAIRNTMSKYVTFEKDAIFKDPDWPHMWEHKR